MPHLVFYDEDRATVESVSTYLGWYGFQVECPADALGIIPALKKIPADLLICGEWFQGGGFSRLHSALGDSEDPSLRGVRILVVGLEEVDHARSKLLRKQGIHYMTKYKSPEEWLQKIQAILRQL